MVDAAAAAEPEPAAVPAEVAADANDPVVISVVHDWRIPETLEKYIKHHDLVAVPSLEDIGVCVPAPADGSCGYNALILGGWYVGLFNPIVEAERNSWKHKERYEDRKVHLKKYAVLSSTDALPLPNHVV